MKTIGSALRDVVVASTLYGDNVWRDRPVGEEAFPYCTFTEPTSLVPVLQGDGGRVAAYQRMCTVDSWQEPGDPDAYDRFEALVRAVDGARLVADQHTFRCRVTQAVAVDDDVIHHSLTVLIHHVP